MTDWPTLLRIPDGLTTHGRPDAWFSVVAERFLNGAELIVARQAYRFLELEFYLFDTCHPDPFSHRDPLQLHCGRWYFHRSHGAYRGGSYKGFDLTLGNGTTSGGILFRTLEKADGTVINGPSLIVDQLLKATGADSVAALDRMLAQRRAWDAANPLLLRHRERLERRDLLRTARVGMSLRRASAFPEMPRYMMRPYRFLIEPSRVRKGKAHMVLALYARGDGLDTIHRVTGCPRASIRRYIEEFEAGRREGDFAPHFGVETRTKEWCRLYGIWQRVHGIE